MNEKKRKAKILPHLFTVFKDNLRNIATIYVLKTTKD